MEDENFNKELEDFFRLFKHLIEKESAEGGIPGVDPAQMEQLKALMAQFDDVKEDLRVELHKVDPFTKMMISSIVKQLREQLGPEADELDEIALPSAEDIVSRREEELRDIVDDDVRARALIATIDEQLKNPNLGDAEIDALLDKRSQISRNISGD